MGDVPTPLFDKIVQTGEAQVRREQANIEQIKQAIIEVTPLKDNPYRALLVKEKALSLFERTSADYDVARGLALARLEMHARSCGWSELEAWWQIEDISWLLLNRSRGGWQQDELIKQIQHQIMQASKDVLEQAQSIQGGLK